MSEPPPSPGEQQTTDELAALYVCRLACGVSPFERQEIYSWVARDPRHAVAFARAEAAWETSARLRAAPPCLEGAPAAPQRPTLPRRAFLGGAAAAVAAAATVAWRLVDNVELHRTRLGERRTLRLSDGTRVDLNTASALEVAYDGDARRVRLVRGEGLFDVFPDPDRPFLVDAGSARFRALGTVFNVRMREEVVELTVTHGSVAVDAAGEKTTRLAQAPRIRAGAGAVVRSGAVAATRLDPERLRQRTAWQDGVVEFNGESLAQAVAEFNRYQPAPIVIGDERLGSLRVGGRFEVDEVDLFLTALSSSFPIRAVPMERGGVLLVERQ